MRDIKFRGKRVDNGKWVYGYYLFARLNDRRTLRKPYEFVYENASLPYICPVKKRWGDVFFDEGCNDVPVAVVRNSIGEYTGLKDKNGVEIYEGDICRWANTEGRVYKRTVEWDSIFLCWNFGVMKYCQLKESGYYQTKMEVIGNIHDNPELMGSK